MLAHSKNQNTIFYLSTTSILHLATFSTEYVHLLITRQSIRNTFVTFAVEHDVALSQYFPGVEEVLRSFI